MVIKQATLETVCGITSVLPQNRLPEIAMAGKSNVGKSSCINKLVCRKALARTSSEPGKTQTINFYNLNLELYLVDLPRYGYEKVSKEEQKKWGVMIEKYLQSSKVLKAVLLLIDVRHAPGENDKLMYEWILSQGYRPVIICTKTDKLKRSQLPKAIKTVKEGLELDEDSIVIPFSAETGNGCSEIWNFISSVTEKH